MLGEILQAVKTLAETYASSYTAISNGALPPSDGLAIYPGPGFPTDRYFDRGATYEVPFVLNGKHSDLSVLLGVMSEIHRKLSTLTAYPRTDDWQILDIESATPPNYLDKETSGQWLYGSILSVKFYVKGV